MPGQAVRKNFKNNNYSKIPWLTMVLLAVGIIFLLIQIINVARTNYALSKKAEQVKEELAAERIKQEELAKKVDQINSEVFSEELIREKGMYRRKGEAVVYIEENSDHNNSTNTDKKSSKNYFSFFSSILQNLKDIFK